VRPRLHAQLLIALSGVGISLLSGCSSPCLSQAEVDAAHFTGRAARCLPEDIRDVLERASWRELGEGLFRGAEASLPQCTVEVTEGNPGESGYWDGNSLYGSEVTSVLNCGRGGSLAFVERDANGSYFGEPNTGSLLVASEFAAEADGQRLVVRGTLHDLVISGVGSGGPPPGVFLDWDLEIENFDGLLPRPWTSYRHLGSGTALAGPDEIELTFPDSGSVRLTVDGWAPAPCSGARTPVAARVEWTLEGESGLARLTGMDPHPWTDVEEATCPGCVEVHSDDTFQGFWCPGEEF